MAKVDLEEPGAVTGSRFESAYERLKAAITDGAYTPNQRLVELDVAATLEVSRATARAVLARLRQEGYVQIEPNRGARVRSFSIEEAVRILEVREVLEGLAASLAAQHATDDHLEQLRTTLGLMEQLVAAGDLLGYSSTNGRFHRIILQAAHHEFVDRLLGSLNYPLIRYQFRTVLFPGRKDESLAEHREILACLVRRDAAGAERAMRLHVSHVRLLLQQTSEVKTF